MESEKRFYKKVKPFLESKDHVVSGESFELMYHPEFDLLVTSPVPTDLYTYYKSPDYISHTDSHKTIFDKVYQEVKKYTLKKKLSLINSFQTPTKTILDIGAGTGDFLKICKENEWTVSGVEPNLGARNIAQEKEVFLTENLPTTLEKKFDVITMWHVLEHVSDLTAYIKTAKSLLKQKGKIVVAVPNFKSYDAKYYNKYWAAYDLPRHLWHFSQTSIEKLFFEVEMEVVKTVPMKFDAFYVSLLSEKYKSGKMNPIKSFIIGARSNLKARKTTEYSSLIYIIKNK
jgi:ubiquinone/menaquinone biosynthesis C-methylase UbiE